MLRVSFVVRSTEILPVFLGLPSLCFHVAEPTRKSACRLPQIASRRYARAPELLPNSSPKSTRESTLARLTGSGSRIAPELPNRLPTRRANLRANQRWLDDEVKHGSDLPKPAPTQVRTLPNLRAGSRPRRHPDQRVWAPESTHSGRTGSQIAPAYAPASTGLGAPESTARGSTPRSQGFGRPNCSRIRRIESTRKSGSESGLCSRLDGWPQSSPPRPAKQQAPTSGRPRIALISRHPKQQVRPGSGLPQVDGSRIYARARRRRKGFEFAPESTGSRLNDFEPPKPHADRSWFGLSTCLGLPNSRPNSRQPSTNQVKQLCPSPAPTQWPNSLKKCPTAQQPHSISPTAQPNSPAAQQQPQQSKRPTQHSKKQQQPNPSSPTGPTAKNPAQQRAKARVQPNSPTAKSSLSSRSRTATQQPNSPTAKSSSSPSPTTQEPTRAQISN